MHIRLHGYPADIYTYYTGPNTRHAVLKTVDTEGRELWIDTTTTDQWRTCPGASAERVTDEEMILQPWYWLGKHYMMTDQGIKKSPLALDSDNPDDSAENLARSAEISKLTTDFTDDTENQEH